MAEVLRDAAWEDSGIYKDKCMKINREVKILAKKSKRRKNKKPNGDFGGSKINSLHESLIKKYKKT